MAWHIMASSHFDFDEFRRASEADLRPFHLVPSIVEALDGKLHQPSADASHSTLIDRIGAFFYGQPENWTAARHLVKQLNHGDAVYVTGDGGGVPIGLLCALYRKKVSLAVHFVDTKRVRTRIFGWILAVLIKRLLVTVTLDQQSDDALATFGRKAEDVYVVKSQTDTDFFRPPATRNPNTPPMLTSCGAEQRDYATFAAAIEEPIIVVKPTIRVCFASPNLSTKTRYTMPDPVPVNMDFRYYDFDDLRDLYQTADLLVLPLMQNRYSAGLTTLFEAMACECPVIVADIPGVIGRFIENDFIVGYEPGNSADLGAKIAELLSDPEAASSRATLARAELMRSYSTEAYLNRLQTKLLAFENEENAPPGSLEI